MKPTPTERTQADLSPATTSMHIVASDGKLHMPRASLPICKFSASLRGPTHPEQEIDCQPPISGAKSETKPSQQKRASNISSASGTSGRSSPRGRIVAEAPRRVTSPSSRSYFTTPSPNPSSASAQSSRRNSGHSQVSSCQASNPARLSMSSTLSSPSSNSIVLKISYGSCIIVLKVLRDIAYVDLREKIYAKFVGQEGVPLSADFVILTTSGDIEKVESEEHWLVVEGAFKGTKLVLKVVDPIPKASSTDSRSIL